MLKPLYDYAMRYQLLPPPGMVKKTVKAWVCLGANGTFLGVRQDGEDEYFCPDIGSLANGKDKCNVLVEKYEVVFWKDTPESKVEQREEGKKPKDNTLKHRYFLASLQQAAQKVPELSVCVHLLEDETCCEQVRQELMRLKLKPSDRVSFEIAGTPIVEILEVQEWWREFRQQFAQHGAAESLCLITGEKTMPVATLPPIKGLLQVGGHGRGDALFCFDKPAFCSYGLKQSANAPVSAESIDAVKAALDHLMSSETLSPTLAGMRFVHWFDCYVSAECDPMQRALDGDSKNQEAEQQTEDDDGYDDDEEFDETVEAPSNPDAERDIAAKRIESIESGAATTAIPASTQYYILLLSGVTGRVMVRSYDHGNYGELEESIQQWRNDLQMVNLGGTGFTKINSLKAMMIRLMPRQKSEKNVFKRMDKELSGITPAVLHAILTDSMLPDSVAVRALRYIRNQMASASEEDKHAPVPDAMCCQWLKVWLIRKNNRKEGVIEAMYQAENTNVAYRCGAWVAVYASMQQFAMRDVQAGIVQRYYASACQMPALVLGQLSILSVPHQDKIKGDYLKMYLEMLDKVTCDIGEIPTMLNLEQQAYFALGYRQMTAELNRKRNELRKVKKEQKAAAETDEEE